MDETRLTGQVALVTGASVVVNHRNTLFIDGGMTLYPGFRGHG